MKALVRFTEEVWADAIRPDLCFEKFIHSVFMGTAPERQKSPVQEFEQIAASIIISENDAFFRIINIH